MVDDPYLLPDPLITANIYCAGRLDDLIQRGIAPMWQDIRQREDLQSAYLWMIRYRRHGEHLKIRLHGARQLAAPLREHLDTAVQAYLGALEPARPGPNESAENRYSLPIDTDEEGGEDQPDRSLLWTSYRRSPITFGPELFIADDRFIAILTRAMGHGAERALAMFSAQESADLPFRARQTALIKAVISGLAGVEWSADDRARYLAYHRNWLLRYLLVRANEAQARAAGMLERFAANMDKMGASLGAIRKTLAAQWEWQGSPTEHGWTRTLYDLVSHVDEHYPEQAAEELDPFARQRAYPVVFKLLHGVANPLGIQPLDESFVYHLLLHCYAAHEDRGFDARPS
jgi:hypothetical protein